MPCVGMRHKLYRTPSFSTASRQRLREVERGPHSIVAARHEQDIPTSILDGDCSGCNGGREGAQAGFIERAIAHRLFASRRLPALVVGNEWQRLAIPAPGGALGIGRPIETRTDIGPGNRGRRDGNDGVYARIAYGDE